MRGRRLRQIEDLAMRVLEEAGITSIPVDLNYIAAKYQIKLVGYSLSDDISGLLVIKEGQITIASNDNQSEMRRRFTIAHELGHYFLAHQRDGLFVDTYKNDLKLYRNSESSTGEILQEREANAFAAALLMPRHHVKRKIAELNIDPTSDDDLSSLAKQFKVSTQAITYRVLNILEL